MNLFLRAKRLFGGDGRFDPSPAADRLPATVIREVTSADHEACIRIYKENEEGSLPRGYLQDFEQDLSSGTCLWLGIEEGDELIAVGGIYLDSNTTGAAALVFGMVRPDSHGMGYGSALLLARIASLPPPEPVTRMVMSSLENSVGFFKQFGFVFVNRAPIDDDTELDFYYAKLTRASWENARALLTSRHVSFDPDAVSVPRSPLRN